MSKCSIIIQLVLVCLFTSCDSSGNYNNNSVPVTPSPPIYAQNPAGHYSTPGFYILNSDASIRSTPDVTGQIVGRFSSGQRIYVSGFVNNHAKFTELVNNPTLKESYVYASFLDKDVSQPNKNSIDNSSYSISSNNNTKSISSSRTYDYSVTGYGECGYVYGDISVTQDGGDGYIYDEEGIEIWVDVSWSGKGTLDGYDSDGNYYELEVD
jgi:hypothetical protein